MSARHVRWVLANRDKYGDPLDREIMVTIASHIGSDDRPATMSIGTIADYVGCHYNTVDKRTKALAEGGLLVIEKQGRYLTYALPGSADDEGIAGEEPGGAPHDCRDGEIAGIKEDIAGLRDDVKELRAIVTSLSHDLHIIVTSPSHQLHTDFTSVQTGDVNKVRKNGSTEEGKYVYTRGGIALDVENGQNDPDARHHMVTAIANVVKETLTPENQDRFNGIADGFLEAGITLGDVDAFGHWWKENGQYAGRPALTSLQNQIRNSIDGVKARASPGRQGGAEEPAGFAAIRAVMQEWDDE